MLLKVWITRGLGSWMVRSVCALSWKTPGSRNGGRRVQPPGNGIGLSNLGFTLYRGGPLCQPTYNWEMLVPGVCRALVLIPVDNYIREGSFQPRLKLNPRLVLTGLLPVRQENKQRDQPGFYRCGEDTTNTSRASTGVARTRRCQPGFYRNDEVPNGLLPVWQEWAARTANQPGFYRCDDGISMKAPTGLLLVWAKVAGMSGSGFPDAVSRPA